MRGPEAKLDTVKRLCAILHEVHERRVGYDRGPCDCICPDREGNPNNWQSDGEALEWLEKLVKQLPKGKVTVDIVERWQMGPDGRPVYHGIELRHAAEPNSEGHEP